MGVRGSAPADDGGGTGDYPLHSGDPWVVAISRPGCQIPREMADFTGDAISTDRCQTPVRKKGNPPVVAPSPIAMSRQLSSRTDA